MCLILHFSSACVCANIYVNLSVQGRMEVSEGEIGRGGCMSIKVKIITLITAQII